MKVVCCYCGKGMREKEPLENKKTSHSACDECFKKEYAKLDEEADEDDKLIIIG